MTLSICHDPILPPNNPIQYYEHFEMTNLHFEHLEYVILYKYLIFIVLNSLKFTSKVFEIEKKEISR
ncbi:hypothetical protein D3C76_353650 [compost metagenome]